MTADIPAVPDPAAVREALAWFRENLQRVDALRTEGPWPSSDHAWTVVRAALARDDVGSAPDLLRECAEMLRGNLYGVEVHRNQRVALLRRIDTALARDVPAPTDKPMSGPRPCPSCQTSADECQWHENACCPACDEAPGSLHRVWDEARAAVQADRTGTAPADDLREFTITEAWIGELHDIVQYGRGGEPWRPEHVTELLHNLRRDRDRRARELVDAETAATRHHRLWRETAGELGRLISEAAPTEELATETVPRDLLESFVDGDDCRFDHRGGCQAHGYISLRPGELCPQAELKQLLGWGAS